MSSRLIIYRSVSFAMLRRDTDASSSSALYDAISRVVPAASNFEFHSGEEFKEKAGQWSQRLAGRAFQVRLHRRRDRHGLHTAEVEKFPDDVALAAASVQGRNFLSRTRMS
jgi:hypothetical protein